MLRRAAFALAIALSFSASGARAETTVIALTQPAESAHAELVGRLSAKDRQTTLRTAASTLLARIGKPRPKGKPADASLARSAAREAGFVGVMDMESAALLVALEAMRDVHARINVVRRELEYVEAAKRCKGTSDTRCVASIKVKGMTEEEAKATRERLKARKDSISELSQEDMLMLQTLMEKKSQLEQVISNVMRSGFEGGSAASQELKAS